MAAAAFTAFTVTSTVAAGQAERNAFEAQADEAMLQASQEDIAAERETLIGRQRSNAIREELTKNLSAQQAAAGASGLSASSEIFSKGEGKSASDAFEAVRQTQANAFFRSRNRRLQAIRKRREAALLRQSGRVSERLGLLQGAAQVAKFGIPGQSPAAGSASLGVREAGAFG